MINTRSNRTNAIQALGACLLMLANVASKQQRRFILLSSAFQFFALSVHISYSYDFLHFHLVHDVLVLVSFLFFTFGHATVRFECASMSFTDDDYDRQQEKNAFIFLVFFFV